MKGIRPVVPCHHIREYTYAYDGTQNTKKDDAATTEYTYDGRGQLIRSVAKALENTSLRAAATMTAKAGRLK